ncbi:MAG TPA: TfoX/Sxy family protein [Kofleriaceae bacterium]|jgi:TfoX/Sxy family transcriptional regulator of competence genes|nr:TfoX/Sxy family protein [Kofleriaceae bacterium]
MSYDENLADRIRRVVGPTRDVVEKKMFGGLAFLVDGKMFIGIANKDLMVRVGADAYEAALARRHARPMDFTGRPLTGYIYVSPAGSRTDDAVADWARQAMRFVRTVPAKTKRKRARRQPRAKRS